MVHRRAERRSKNNDSKTKKEKLAKKLKREEQQSIRAASSCLCACAGQGDAYHYELSVEFFKTFFCDIIATLHRCTVPLLFIIWRLVTRWSQRTTNFKF